MLVQTVDVLPVILPQRTQNTVFLFLPFLALLAGVSFRKIHFGWFLHGVVSDPLDDILFLCVHIGMKPGRILGHHAKRLTFIRGNGHIYVDNTTIEDLTFGTVHNYVFPLLFIVFVLEDGIDVELLDIDHRLVQT